jgi:hypothetical protein
VESWSILLFSFALENLYSVWIMVEGEGKEGGGREEETNALVYNSSAP